MDTPLTTTMVHLLKINKEDNIMKLLIIGTNLTVTDTIRKYTESKLEPLTKYKTVQDKQFKATISKLDHDEKQIKVNIDTLIATASDKDLYAAIDIVVEKLDKQLRKEKTKQLEFEQQREPLKHQFIEPNNKEESEN